jgi:hypothetical protein
VFALVNGEYLEHASEDQGGRGAVE